MNKYWNNKFKEKKFVWGTEESLAARIVLDDIKSSFKSYESLKLLDIGCGYGRDVNYFRNNGLDAMGIDNSGEAIILGKEQWPDLCLEERDIFDYQIGDKLDIVYCNFFIHLFLEEQRKIIIDKIYGMMNKNGVAYFITSSDRDEDYMKGKAIGDHLIVNERGVMKYYFNEDSIKKEQYTLISITSESMVRCSEHLF